MKPCKSLRAGLRNGLVALGCWLALGDAASAQVPYQVKDITPAGSSDPYYLGSAGGLGYFFVSFDGSFDNTLWRSDGTEAGTFRLSETVRPSHARGIDGVLFFLNEVPNTGYDLWKTDGTRGGTVPLTTGSPVTIADLMVNDLVAVGQTLYFPGRAPSGYMGLWKSDGTPQGTSLVADTQGIIAELTNVAGTLFFRWFTDQGGPDSAIWKSDGTAAGTVRITDIGPGPGNFEYLQSLRSAGGLLFFRATYEGADLWRTDGSSQGTFKVKDVAPGPPESDPLNLVGVDDFLYFTMSDFPRAELWRSDGTPEGTVLVKDIGQPQGYFQTGIQAVLNGRLYFNASDFVQGFELWTSDGTAPGTRVVKDIYAGPGDSMPFFPVAAGGSVFFSADDSSHGSELWRSDGTEAGTALVHDIAPGPGHGFPSWPGAAGGRLFFSADASGDNRELWALPIPLAISVEDAGVVEGTGGGPRNLAFRLVLSGPSATPVTVAYQAVGRSALPGVDFTAVSGTATVPAGALSQDVIVPVLPDNLDEDQETLALVLSSPVGASLNDSRAIGVIHDDDQAQVSIGDVTVTEGHAGATAAILTASLSVPSARVVTVNYGTAAGTATAGVDFGTVAGTVTFPPGSTTRPVAVPVLGDRLQEPDETFFVNLSGPVGAVTGDGQGLGTIADDDAAGLSISDVAVRERVTPNAAAATFTVTLAPTSPGMVTVNWATADGTATAGSDYAAGSGPLSFAPGQSTQTVNVTVNADSLVEGMETFTVNLSGASGAGIAHGTGTAQVLDPPAGGDFDGDNRNDLLWRHDVSGQNVLWFMNGENLISGTFTTPPTLADVRWKMVGTNDFNADGRPDILWRHSTSGQNVLWYMNGSVLTTGTFLTPPSLADVRWRMSGTGDFNLDGKPDILWRHAQSGEIVVWFMNGPVLQSGTFLTPPAFTDVNWETVGTGDFSGDGKTDILWRHAVAGQNVVWFLEGTSLVSGAYTNPPTLADVRWKMVATGDYNFDGKVDIVWRHSQSGQNVMWFMDGIDLVSGAFTNPSLPDTGWKIVGPR